MIIGYYNELHYRIELNSKQVYEAGNHPLDSGSYVSANQGVGLRKMRHYCYQTTKEIAEENAEPKFYIERED